MSSVRKLITASMCAALLGVVGASAAGAQGTARCDRIAKITARIEAKQARIAERRAANPRTDTQQGHVAKFDAKRAKLQEKATLLEQRCAD
jgi:hypothetical protein